MDAGTSVESSQFASAGGVVADLTLHVDTSTTQERAAVDAVVPPENRAVIHETERLVRGGTARRRDRRHLLLPGLHALQHEVGWISPGGLNYLCGALQVPPAEGYGVATFYEMFRTTDPGHTEPVHHVCMDTACHIAGADDLARSLEAQGRHVHRGPCLGQCERAPARFVQGCGEPDHVPADAEAIERPGSYRLPQHGEPAPESAGSTGARRGSGAITPTTELERDGSSDIGSGSAGVSSLGSTSTDPVRDDAATRSEAPRDLGGSDAAGASVDRTSLDTGAPDDDASHGLPTSDGSGSEPGGYATSDTGGEGGEGDDTAANAEPSGQVARSTRSVSVGSPGGSGLRLLKRVGVVDPTSLGSYRDHGGYLALQRAIDIGSQAVIDEIRAAGLSGRGGAAFPTAIKWEGVADQQGRPKHVVANADESEPGTFKDRIVMENDPFSVIEGLTLAALATGAENGWIYVRGEYPLATSRLTNAIEQCRTAGLLGGDVLASGRHFDIELRRGAGAYICGEETALLESIEGFRGEPRNKPPFPSTHGLFGEPTAVNNPETLLNALFVVEHGPDTYRLAGTEQSPGTRLFCLSGHVAVPGLYEVAMGTTLGDVIDLAGGATGTTRAILMGGAAGSFVGPDDLDMPLTQEDARERGTALGSGVITVFDDTVDFTSLVLRIAQFFENESCGQCVPCRVGVVRQREVLVEMSARGFLSDDRTTLIDDMARAMGDASICGLGHTASGAVQSAIRLGLIGPRA